MKTADELLPVLTQERDQFRKERDEAQAVVRAWQSVFDCIDAHIRDRMAMRDEADPEAYLRIIHSHIAHVIRDSKQIVAARWADYARHEAERDQLRAKLAEYEKLVKEAYNEGFLQGMREHTSSRGGIPWSMSAIRSRTGGENE